MKQLKINSVAAFAILTAVTTMSFKAIDSMVSEKQGFVWYLQGDDPDNWDLYDGGNLHLDPPAPCNEPTGEVCAKGFPNIQSEPVTDDTESPETRLRDIN